MITIAHFNYAQETLNIPAYPIGILSIDTKATIKIELNIFDAVKSNDITLVKEILTKNPKDINSRDNLYRTPLMYATDDSLEIVKYLVSTGAFLNTQDNSGNSVLMLASEQGYAKLVALILTYPMQVNSENKLGLSALHLATKNGHTKTVELLIQNRADIDELMPNGLPPIFEAITKGYTAILGLFLAKGADVNDTVPSTQTSLLSIASALGKTSSVQVLLEKGADPNLANKLGITPIFLSISKQHHEITKLLIAHKADLTIKTKDGVGLKDIILPTDKATKKLIDKQLSN